MGGRQKQPVALILAKDLAYLLLAHADAGIPYYDMKGSIYYVASNPDHTGFTL